MPIIESRINTTEISRQNENFKDLDLDFLAHPATSDVVKKTGVNAIKRAMRNLLFLKEGELGFNPNKGSGIYHLLFEPFTPAIIELLSREIHETLSVFEPRIDIYNIVIEEDRLDKNGINIDIHFYIKNYNEPVNLQIFLERVR